jgi:hypothetical protein
LGEHNVRNVGVEGSNPFCSTKFSLVDQRIFFQSPPRAFALEDWFTGDYLHGDRFAALGDFRFSADSGAIPAHIVSEGEVLYCKTDRVVELFAVLRSRRRPCILITHNSDYNVTQALFASRPACVRHWFAQNAMVEHPDLTPIPIGVERPHVSGGRTRPEVFRAVASHEPRMTRNLACLVQADWTNRWERTPVRWALARRNWVTNSRRIVPFAEYLEMMFQHRAVVSPPGNGFDCHRTWEALYLGVVPLVKAGPATRYFARLLPIAIFDRLTTLTRRRVERSLKRLTQRDFANALRFSWWADLIARTRARLRD